MRRVWIGMCLTITALIAGGCSNLVDQDQVQIRPDTTVMLQADHTVGQTVVARHAGLNGIEFYLSPAAGAEGAVDLRLRESPIETDDVLTSSVSLGPGSSAGFYRFSFPPLFNSHTGYFYATLEYTGTEEIEVPTGDLDSYLDGTLYYDDEPQESQAVFRLSYDRLLIMKDLVLLASTWLGYGAAVVGLLFFAGYPLVLGWARGAGLDFTSSLVLGAVSVLALWMVLLVWADVFGVRLDGTRVRLMVGIGALLGLGYFIRDREQWRRSQYWTGNRPLMTLALWSVVVLSIGLRLFVGRGMVMLPGSDTYHHTLIVQLFMEQGGIPQSYEPYAPLITFSYHWGFHSIVALFRWLFGSEMLVSTKTVALVMNGAIAAATGWLCEELTGKRRSGVVAAALVGLIAVSPFCLLRWGRFTQTAGLLFLPMALWAMMIGAKEDNRGIPPLLVAGTVLSHYRVGFFLGAFAVIAGAIGGFRHGWEETRGWMITGAVSLALTAPWLLHVFQVQQDPYQLQLAYPLLEGQNALVRLEEEVLSFVTNKPFIVGSLLSAILACFWGEHQSTAQALVIWCAVLILGPSTFPALIPAGFWDLKSVVLSLPIPLATLGGLAEQALSGSAGRRQRAVRRAISLALMVGTLSSLLRLPKTMYNGQLYLRPGNLVAMEWIRDNTPQDARFLVDSVQVEWSPGWVLGTNAGYWIPLLAHRDTALPPMVYPLEWSERPTLFAGLTGEYELQMADGRQAPLSPQILDVCGITHVFTSNSPYLGQGAEDSPHENLREVYRQDRLRVLTVTG